MSKLAQYDRFFGMIFIHVSLGFTDLAKVSQNPISFNLGKYLYLNFLNLENYLIWTDRTDSKPILRWDPVNAYFWILGFPPGCLEKSFHVSR